jgi:hypothetical protein
MSEHRDPIRDRFDGLADPRDDSDWSDVRRRARRRGLRTGAVLAAATAVLVALIVAPGIGLGGRIIGLFTGPGKPVPLAKLASNDQRMVVTSLCRHVTLVTPPGRAPQTKCRDGSPTVSEIANNGERAYWKIAYPDGRLCVASGSAHIRRDRIFGDSQIGEMGCSEGASAARLLPSPKRPITTQIAGSFSPGTGEHHLTRVTGLAGEGVATVALVDKGGFAFKTSAEGRQYALAGFPSKNWVAIVAYDASGSEVYREDLPGRGTPRPVQVPAAPRAEPPPVYRPQPPPAGKPIQHAEVAGATIDVYASGVAAVDFTSETGPFAFLRKHGGERDGVTLECGLVAFGAGRWATYSWGASRPLAREVRANVTSRPPMRGGGPTPPFDACAVRGRYGRRWDEHVGYHSAVEFAFNDTAKRFFAERAAARRIAYFVRSPKMHEIRRALKAGGTAPSSEEIAARFDSSVVALATKSETPPLGKVGVWSDREATIVASERADDGRRMWVELDHGRLGPHNLHSLAFVF